jgi:hypothetical protein
MPDTPFGQHAYDEVPIGRNIAPIPECKVAPALKDGKVIDVVDVPILGCAGVWLRCQQEAERWISDCDGVLLHKPEQVNARINSAYAYLWLQDKRFQWAGLAAFASKQVGCGLLHSAQIEQEASASLKHTPKMFGGEVLPTGLADQIALQGAAYMRRRLALGNRTLFLDIYPLHRFYSLRGIAGLRKCLHERKSIMGKVKMWPDHAPSFGSKFKEILAAFEAIESGDIQKSVRRFAFHEQVNVLQNVLYDDPQTQTLLDLNQAAWVTGFPSGRYEEVQLTLSAQCKPKLGVSTWFKKSPMVHLWNETDRMEFVYRAAADFDKLLRKNGAEVERSIRAISQGGGIE